MARDMNSERPSESALHLLHRAGQIAGELFQLEMARTELTPRQFAILSTLADDEGASQSRLVARTGIDRSTLADVMRRLVRKGLLERSRTPNDARSYAIRLTEAGRRALHSAHPVVVRVDEAVLSKLPELQRERFIENLRAIVGSFARGAPRDQKPARG